MPANLMSNATSCGPTSRRSMVVLVSGSVAEVAAIAETVVVIFSAYPLVVLSSIRRRLSWRRHQNLDASLRPQECQPGGAVGGLIPRAGTSQLVSVATADSRSSALTSI